MTRLRRAKTAVHARRAKAHAPHPPGCRRCGEAMRLFGIEPHPTIKQAALRTYVCDQCDSVQTATTNGTAKRKAAAPTLAPFVNKAFDDEMTTRLGEAYEAAWRVLEASGSPLAEGSHAAATRERLAKCILEVGRRGETDTNRLIENALGRWAGFNSGAARPAGH